jgi:acyl carrier protein
LNAWKIRNGKTSDRVHPALMAGGKTEEGSMSATTEVGDVYRTITPIFREVFDDETLEIGPETTAEDVDGWDSLSHIRLIVSVEKTLGLKFTSAEIGALKNVGDFVSLIRSKRQ